MVERGSQPSKVPFVLPQDMAATLHWAQAPQARRSWGGFCQYLSQPSQGMAWQAQWALLLGWLQPWLRALVREQEAGVLASEDLQQEAFAVFWQHYQRQGQGQPLQGAALFYMKRTIKTLVFRRLLKERRQRKLAARWQAFQSSQSSPMAAGALPQQVALRGALQALVQHAGKVLVPAQQALAWQYLAYHWGLGQGSVLHPNVVAQQRRVMARLAAWWQGQGF